MKTLTVFAVALLAWMCWAASPVSAAGGDVSAVNKSVSAAPGETYGKLSTVNGDVHVGRGATAEMAKTVNGSIRVESDARVGSLKTVNGELEIADGVSIDGEAHTVNGDVEMGRRSRAGGAMGTVNGDIELEGAEIGGQLTTNNGDIDLKDGARVLGGIHVRKSKNWGWKKSDPVEVTICSTCVVEGELRFDRPVRLRVEDGARIGKVIGDEVTRL